MKNILVMVATGYEDTELITPIDIFKREEIGVTLASVENKSEVEGMWGSSVKTTPLKKVEINDFDAIFLPGGNGHVILKENKETLMAVNSFHKSGKLVTAICAAPVVLIEAGIMDGVTFTSHPGYAETEKRTGSECEKDANIITGRDFRAAAIFADAIVSALNN